MTVLRSADSVKTADIEEKDFEREREYGMD